MHYYDNVELRNKIKIQQLKDELSEIINTTDHEVLSKIDVNHDELTRVELMNKLVAIEVHSKRY
ncbi:hypothetical protein KCK34_002278 [Clostridium perfringens]|uniref:Phage protein n=1 Tax=Clostridium perfringens F262 TaxID=883064 RepID=A0AAV3FGZ3_CLOPF|nr:hypothetical protein [Clostridium perfringens]EIA18579.1 hypothetical protein HA1_00728 [Clostridium perfringens F262]EHK2335818.1 hypothetical protein [Clostridium perfringens]MBO3350827.1 hypothetical protein [Clostridium perfringens]MBO3366324.1 hypothetical protein [Clostridium perfringens]MDU5040115.1 hypothetical protein [Clostridium perfringens]